MGCSREADAPASARRSAGAGVGWRARRREWMVGYALSLPAIAVVLALIGWPALTDVALSFTGARHFAVSGPFVGLANYAALAADPEFWLGVRDLAFLLPLTVAVELVVGFATALLLRWRFWGRALVFLAVFVPWAFPTAFSAFAWYSLVVPPFPTFYEDQAVAVKLWMSAVFGGDAISLVAYGVMSVWRVSSIIAIFLLAGLNTIPEELLDFGRLEARSAFRYLRDVVVPLGRRYLVLAVLVATVITYLDYDSVYLQSGGRETVPVFGTLAYQRGIMLGDTAYAAALDVITLPLFLALALVGLHWLGPDAAARGPLAPGALEPAGAPAEPLGPRSGGAGPRRSRGSQPRLPWRWRKRLLRAGGGLAAVLVMAFHLFPVYYVFVQAVKPVQEQPLGQPFFVYHPDFAPFLGALHPDPSTPIWLWARNTLVCFGLAIALGTVAGMLAGYALARLRPPGAGWLARLAFACFFVPQFAVIVPLFSLYRAWGLDDTITGLVLVYTAMVTPFSTWLFTSYFQGLDRDVEDHARLDAGRVQAFFRVVVPMSWPVAVAAGLFGVGVLGSDVLYAGVLALGNSVKTLPDALGVGAIDLDEWANVSADILLASVPLIALCAALGRTFVRGIQAALLEGA